MDDYIVLVNKKNEVIGTTEKLAAHNKATPLHRGISVFLFDKEGNLLLQQRSKNKKTWPLVWSNSCCGHPKLQETPIETAKRRLAYELGISEVELNVVLPDYRYRFEKDGIVENEFCPVMVGVTDQKPKINPEEVESVRWIAWNEWLEEINKNPQHYSPWCVEETLLLAPFFHETIRKLINK